MSHCSRIRVRLRKRMGIHSSADSSAHSEVDCTLRKNSCELHNPPDRKQDTLTGTVVLRHSQHDLCLPGKPQKRRSMSCVIV